MRSTVCVYKQIGLTPLQAIEIFKKYHPEYATSKIGYAGRLDPMAEGLLLLLVGDENKKRKQYEALPKTYEFSVLPGISTDTYDLMGKITDTAFEFDNNTVSTTIRDILPSLTGTREQFYPPYSSRTVNGKPLYWYARENKLDEITIPSKKVTITSLTLLSSSPLPKNDLVTSIENIIPEVQGDFRQKEILDLWKKKYPLLPSPLHLIHFSVACTSGTYVRQLTQELAEKTKVPLVTYSIKRTHIGDFTIEDTVNIQSPR